MSQLEAEPLMSVSTLYRTLSAAVFLCISFLSSQAMAACIDPDGDGWGWDGERSCLVSTTSTQVAGQCVDEDGDGWGWDGQKSCRISAADSTPRLLCEDPDGDGWGWDGQQSCRVGGGEAVSGAVEPAAGETVTSAADPAVTPVMVQSASEAAGQEAGTGELDIPMTVCEVASGQSSCGVVVSFNASGSGPHCLFERSASESTTARLVTCGNPTKTRVDVAADQSKIIELRSGSLAYQDSAWRDEKTIVGIRSAARSDFQLTDVRRNDYLQNSRSSGLATSWDSRLVFGVAGAGNGKHVAVVRVLRSERMSNQSVNVLESRDLYSADHVLASDALSSAEISNSRLRLPGSLGTNEIGIKIPFNIAVYPNDRYATNPYRSNANGQPDDFGQFETYRFYAVMGANQAGNVSSEHDLISGNNARGKKFFLTRFEASVVVSNARTSNAAVHEVIVHSTAQPLRDTNGQLMYGYEASATLDGRMIIYSGNSNPAVKVGHGGEVLYVYNANQHSSTGWSTPTSIIDMYYRHGPGSPGGETRLGDHLFSEHFAFAAQPVRQYNGETTTAGGVLKGSYPWVSLRGSEIFFMARNSFHGGNRSGATMVGYRTGGQLWHMDGDINNARGNPTDAYNHFAATNAGQYQLIRNAYEARQFPGTNNAMGRNTWNNLFFRPLGEYPSSWSAVAEVTNAPVPLNPFPESYGLWLTGDRYYEIPFPLYPQDLVAFYPMNEPLYHDQTLLRAWQKADANSPSEEQNRRYATDYVTDKTADLSSYQHTGQFVNGARYPFEHYDVKRLWATQRVLKDQSEGAVGNSVFLPQSASIVSQLTSSSLRPVFDNQSFAVALWFNASALSQVTQLLQIDDLVTLTVQQGSLTAEVNHDGAVDSHRTNVNLRSNHWHHVALSWSTGESDLYVDGRLVASFNNGGELLIQPQSQRLVIGPNGRGAQNLLLKVDEVYVYSTYLSAADVSTLAWRQRSANTSGNAFFVSSGMTRDYPGQTAGVDGTFRPLTGEASVGEKLFNSTALSRDNTISCASCHQSGRAFTDGQRLATGIGGVTGRLNTPAIANLLMSDSYFYHGGAATLEQQSIHTILQNGEMGMVEASRIVSQLPAELRNELQSVYQKEPAISDVARAISTFVKTIRITGTSHFNSSNLTASANRGKRLFNGRANCVACHAGTNFTDNLFHNIGVVSASEGRQSVTDRQSDTDAQKTPTLRNVALTAPYFHDGSAADLAAVVRHYNNQSHRASGKRTDIQLYPLELSESEISDIVEYLRALTGDIRSGQ